MMEFEEMQGIICQDIHNEIRSISKLGHNEYEAKKYSCIAGELVRVACQLKLISADIAFHYSGLIASNFKHAEKNFEPNRIIEGEIKK